MTPAAMPFLQEQTILMIGNTPANGAALIDYLKNQGVRVVVVQDGKQGLQSAQEVQPDLILLDLSMPGMDGIDTCRRLKAMEGSNDVPVIFIFAPSDSSANVGSFEAGVADFIAHPFEIEAAAARIKLHLTCRAMQKQLASQNTQLHDEVVMRQQAEKALRENEESYRTLIEQAPGAVVLFELGNKRFVDVNESAVQLFGMSRAALLQANLIDLSPPQQPDGRSSYESAQEKSRQVMAGDTRAFEWTYRNAAGKSIPCEVRLVPLPTPDRKLIHGSILDLSQRKMAEALRAGQSKLLEMIAKGAPLKETLDSLMLLIESQSEGLFCSVLLLDEDGVHIHPGSGPHLPASYMEALEGFAIGPAVGSCGTAMYRKEAVIVTDILEDPLWAPYKSLIEPHGFRASWSTPIFLNQEVVLGSFAMYYREVRSPGPVEMGLIGVATHIAGIAIERTRREKELQRHRLHLEELITERTAELIVAKERTEVANLALSQANQELASALNTLSIAQEELVRSKKLAALGSLVAGIAHELNTPIGNSLMAASTLAGQTDALTENYEKGLGLKRSELVSYLSDAGKAGEILVRNLNRAANLVTSFKQVAVDQTSSKRRAFLLDEAVAEIMLTLWPTIKKTAFIIQQNIPKDLLLDSYPGPLGQVLTNLVNNALLHGFEERQTGTITIAAQPTTDGRVELTIMDNGVGIPAANLDRIFDPFFTTKLGAGGSGLGLNITHNIVTGMLGGQIHVHSEVGVGTTFTLRLPSVAPQSRTP